MESDRMKVSVAGLITATGNIFQWRNILSS